MSDDYCGCNEYGVCGHCADRDTLPPTSDARALADVRTLDDWAMARKSRCVELFPGGEGWRYLLKFCVNPINDTDEHWCEAGATPDEARAKAVAWVREQKP